MKPLAVDLCCGLGGWTHGLLAEGWDVVGFDVERHVYGDDHYPAQLVLQDILTIDGRQFRGKVSLVVASPPCQFFSYTAMPWTRAKKLAAEVRTDPVRLAKELALFNACVRIGSEAECPIVIENVRGAQPWVGRARWMYGSFALWGDVPALMPMTKAIKVLGFRFDGNGKSFQSASVDHMKNGSALNNARNGQKGIPHRPIGHWTNPEENGTKHYGGPAFGVPYAQRAANGTCRTGSKSNARKAASAMIAKIPLPLSRYIAATFKPK